MTKSNLSPSMFQSQLHQSFSSFKHGEYTQSRITQHDEITKSGISQNGEITKFAIAQHGEITK